MQRRGRNGRTIRFSSGSRSRSPSFEADWQAEEPAEEPAPLRLQGGALCHGIRNFGDSGELKALSIRIQVFLAPTIDFAQ
jgi:hypothetical protein